MTDDPNCEHPRVLRKALEEHERMKDKIDKLEGQSQGWPEQERRQYGALTDEQVERIRDAILASIYEEIGRSVVKKILWVGGAVLCALLYWASSKGYITLMPPKP